MKKIITSLAFMLLGAVLMFKMAPSMMVHEFKSPYGVDETVNF